MTFAQNKESFLIMKTFIESQFGYSALALMFCWRQTNA